MKPGIPWSVKGIGDEAREAAKLAARQSGMTLGEWLNAVILEQSEQTVSRDTAPAMPGRPRGASDATIRLEDLAHQLARLTQRDQDTSAGQVYERTEPAKPDPALFDHLSRRIDNAERQTVDAFAAINERLNSITQQLNESHKVWQPQRPEDVPGYQALEGALRNIVEHIEINDKRTRDQLRAMQDRLSGMGEKASAIDPAEAARNAGAIAHLEGQVAQLVHQFEQLEKSAGYGLSPTVEGHLARLSDRIETVRQSADTAIQHAQSFAAQQARAELEDVEARIQAMLQEAQHSFGQASQSGPSLQKLSADVESLNQRIDDLRTDAASERDLHALKLAIEQLSARIAQGADMRPLADVDRRLAELSQRIEQAGDYSSLGGHLGEIDQRIHELDQRLTQMMQRGEAPGAMLGFEQHITALADRLGAAEQQFSNIATLERTINQLFESIEQSRSWTQGVAEDAANRMADRLIQSNPGWGAAAQQGPSPELRALEEGLAAVRASAEQADQRNQDTLVALHETLEQIVTKLADLETQPQQVVAAPAAPAVPEPALPETPVLPELPSLQPPPPLARQAGLDIFSVPHTLSSHAPEARSAEPSLPPLEMPAAPAAEAAAPAEASGDDFIAAARRAAQAAAQQSSVAATTKSVRAGLEEKRGPFGLPKKLPFSFKRTAKEKKAPSKHPILPAPRKEGSLLTVRRLPLIAAGILLLAAVSAITYKQFAGPRTVTPDTQSQLQPSDRSDPILPSPAGNPVTVTKQDEITAAGTMPSPDDDGELDIQGQKAKSIFNDDLLTASLPPGKSDASLNAIVNEPGAPAAAASANGELPAAEIKPESLREAAGKGNAAAQFIVASRYLDGQSVEQDFAMAARWYQKAAAQGLAPAQYRLATLFERGKGVPLDMATAKLWYERAADRGNVRAMHNLAVIHASVQQGTPDYAKAAHWFAGAAAHGLKDSQFNLAVLYERGMGLKKDTAEALFWYALAALQSDADAAKREAALSAALAPAIVAEVKARAGKWSPKQVSQEANIVAVADQAWQSPAAAEPAAGGTSEHKLESVSENADNPVHHVQQLLAGHGFNIGEADGKLGSRTVNAIRLFELQSGMKVTGKVSDELIEKLESAKAKPPA